jgi:hypothetical protein
MRKRMLQGPLTAVDVRRVRRAVREASRLGTPLNMMLTIHPGRLEQPPSDVGRFFERKVIAWRIIVRLTASTCTCSFMCRGVCKGS